MKRFLVALGFAGAAFLVYAQGDHRSSAQRPFTVVEASISEMQTALEQHRVTSRDLVTQYLVRIALYEDKLQAALAVNPNALQEAEARDQERASESHARFIMTAPRRRAPSESDGRSDRHPEAAGSRPCGSGRHPECP